MISKSFGFFKDKHLMRTFAPEVHARKAALRMLYPLMQNKYSEYHSNHITV